MTIAERRASDLRCPACEHPLQIRDETLHCTECAETVPVVDGIPQFPVPDDQPSSPRIFDFLSPIYETPLWFPTVYRVIGGLFAPIDDRTKTAELLDASGNTVLDVACGTGRFTRYVADEAAFVWGIDLSDGMLWKARRYASRDEIETVGFARMAADDLRFDSGQFDRVACCWALHLFADIPAALAEIRRVLKSGGKFAGTTVTAEYVLGLPGVQVGLQQTAGAHVFARDELRGLLRERGFGAIEFERYGAALFFRAEATEMAETSEDSATQT